MATKSLDGPPELEEEALGKRPVYIYHPGDSSNRYTKHTKFGGIPINLVPESLRNLFLESFVLGTANPVYRVRETRWRRALVNELDMLTRCHNPGCPFKFSLFTGLSQKTCTWCSADIDKSKLRLLRFTDSRGKTLRHKIVYEGDWLGAHHCKVNQEFNFSADSACAQVLNDCQYGLVLRNASKEPFLYQSCGEEARVFSPQTRVPLNIGCTIELGSDGATVEVLNFGG